MNKKTIAALIAAMGLTGCQYDMTTKHSPNIPVTTITVTLPENRLVDCIVVSKPTRSRSEAGTDGFQCDFNHEREAKP